MIMPGRQSRHQVLPPVPMVDSQSQATISSGNLASYSRILRRRLLLLVAAVLLGGGIGYLLTLKDIPIYQAHASLEVQSINENFLDLRDVNPNSGTSGTPEADLQTQVNVIQSESVMGRAIRDLMARNRPIVDVPPPPVSGR